MHRRRWRGHAICPAPCVMLNNKFECLKLQHSSCSHTTYDHNNWMSHIVHSTFALDFFLTKMEHTSIREFCSLDVVKASTEQICRWMKFASTSFSGCHTRTWKWLDKSSFIFLDSWIFNFDVSHAFADYKGRTCQPDKWLHFSSHNTRVAPSCFFSSSDRL